VLGEVKNPGRYQVESNTTIFDLLAQAGGTTQASSEVVYLVRHEKDGTTQRYPINLKGLGDGGSIPTETLQGGDSLFVPHADTFSIMGEVKSPSSYPLEPGMTVMQALARAGGVTDRGSTSRIQIVRRLENDKFVTLKAEMTDVVKPNDVIRVKQSIF
ncbi:MAG TPA: SLBB domain-containing protein, partial [Steroidobacteraceae bacterium]|nr:SLBB domain-containing protein [Steroidobacteraceae bacterium]